MKRAIKGGRSLTRAGLISASLAAAGCTTAAVGAANALESIVERVRTPDGTELHVERVGTGGEVIIIPNALYVADALRPLARPGRTLVFFDLRNRGRSGRNDDAAILARGVMNDVDDIEAVRRHVLARRVSIIGHSYLGLVAALYAQHHPSEVSRVVQIGPMWIDPAHQFPAAESAPDLGTVPDSAELAALSAAVGEGLPVREPAEFCRRWWRVIRTSYVTALTDAEALGDDICGYENEWPQNQITYLTSYILPSIGRAALTEADLRRNSAPTLVVHGTRDRAVAYGAGRLWARLQPQARLLTVVGGGHMPWIEDRRRVIDAIDTFLGGAWPDEAARLE